MYTILRSHVTVWWFTCINACTPRKKHTSILWMKRNLKQLVCQAMLLAFIHCKYQIVCRIFWSREWHGTKGNTSAGRWEEVWSCECCDGQNRCRTLIHGIANSWYVHAYIIQQIQAFLCYLGIHVLIYRKLPMQAFLHVL